MACHDGRVCWGVGDLNVSLTSTYLGIIVIRVNQSIFSQTVLQELQQLPVGMVL